MNHHTPGPWIVESDGVSVAMGDQVVIVDPAPDGAGRDVERANARLIAESPAMLALLKRAAAEIDEVDSLKLWDSGALIRKINAVIARIEGKP